MFKNLTPAEYEVLLRHDFATFAIRCFNDLNPQTRLARPSRERSLSCCASSWSSQLVISASRLSAIIKARSWVGLR